MNKYKNKKVKGFRSKLEKFCRDKLVENKIPFTYEEWSILLQDKFEFTNKSIERDKKTGQLKEASGNIRAITYTPDFVGTNWVIETKGKETADFIIKWKMFKNYLQENKLSYTLYKPTNQKQVLQVINFIKNGNDYNDR